ncbi:hypothetical protein [uncultured Paracoccus sp.]|uniref:hypothetical protein n=1 Tax=uncultured Paracoccus sp. TaxID=189685 RepID=UPI00262D2B3D|nr:hypothetical protein [uncultured Paracoccus sp.]
MLKHLIAIVVCWAILTGLAMFFLLTGKPRAVAAMLYTELYLLPTIAWAMWQRAKAAFEGRERDDAAEARGGAIWIIPCALIYLIVGMPGR